MLVGAAEKAEANSDVGEWRVANGNSDIWGVSSFISVSTGKAFYLECPFVSSLGYNFNLCLRRLMILFYGAVGAMSLFFDLPVDVVDALRQVDFGTDSEVDLSDLGIEVEGMDR